jgi:hypothetical protein
MLSHGVMHRASAWSAWHQTAPEWPAVLLYSHNHPARLDPLHHRLCRLAYPILHITIGLHWSCCAKAQHG